MSARQDDERRIGEIWHAITQLERRLKNGGIGKSVLVAPRNELEELAACAPAYEAALEDACPESALQAIFIISSGPMR